MNHEYQNPWRVEVDEDFRTKAGVAVREGRDRRGPCIDHELGNCTVASNAAPIRHEIEAEASADAWMVMHGGRR